jgi:hypothetical protein
MPNHPISLTDVQNARNEYEANEPRDLFYRAATELVSLALAGRTKLAISEAIAVLLQTWNREYYRFHEFNAQHFTDINNLLSSQRAILSTARKNVIQKLDSSNNTTATTVKQTFRKFELVLGPVGAAKSLHLLAPDYFPLWDRAIARAYVGNLGKAGTNGPRFWQMMCYASQQAQVLIGSGFTANPLKAIDEFNYCHFSRGWI